jgi:hypothetical protein
MREGVPPTAPPLVKKPSLPLVQIKRTRSFSRSEGGRSEGGWSEGGRSEGGRSEGGGDEGGSGEGSSGMQSAATTTQGEAQGEAAQGEVQRERLELDQWWSASPPETPSSLRSSLHSVGAPLPTPPAQRSQPQDQQLQSHMLQGEQLQGQDERAAQTIQAGERGASVRPLVHKL